MLMTMTMMMMATFSAEWLSGSEQWLIIMCYVDCYDYKDDADADDDNDNDNGDDNDDDDKDLQRWVAVWQWAVVELGSVID